jgi:hypothetical protein
MISDVAEVALVLAAFKTNALTGESFIVSHGLRMNRGGRRRKPSCEPGID